jgi:uncharacterized protein
MDEVKTAAQLTEQEIDEYRESFHKRKQVESLELKQRKEQAWTLARNDASLLKSRFGASRVVIFGSLTKNELFTLWSDVDLAAWGLRPEDTLRAIGAVYDLDENIRVNLVDINIVNASFRTTIELDGIEI